MQKAVIRRPVLSLVLALIAGGAQGQEAVPPGCTPIDRAGYVIDRPGQYCLTKDLDTRLDFADHPAENPAIRIGVGNVTVDLRGHRIGRGRLITQRGGNGFMITTNEPDFEPTAAARIKNVTIKNGTLADFGVGVLFYAFRNQVPTLTYQVRQTGANSFTYDEAKIVMENLKFDRCGEDMSIRDWVTR